MKYLFINPTKLSITRIEASSFTDALVPAGLRHGEVDFGTIAPGIGILVSEYGLFEPKEQQAYFGINGNLYAGNALIYGYDDKGENRDAPDTINDVWFAGSGWKDVEAAIERGYLKRPQITTPSGKVIWRWPAPRLSAADDEARSKETVDALIRGDTVVIDGDTSIRVMK